MKIALGLSPLPQLSLPHVKNKINVFKCNPHEPATSLVNILNTTENMSRVCILSNTKAEEEINHCIVGCQGVAAAETRDNGISNS